MELMLALSPLMLVLFVSTMPKSPIDDLALLCGRFEAYSTNHDYVRMEEIWVRISKICHKRGVDAIGLLQQLTPTTPDGVTERFLRRALALQESTLAANSPELIPTLRLLVDNLHMHGKLDEAIALARQILSVRAAAFGEDDVGAAKDHNIIGVMLTKKGLRDQAIWSFRRALEIREKHPDCDPKDFALGLANLGEMLGREGQLDEAELLLRRALAIRERTPNPDDPELAVSLFCLGEILCRKHQHAEAEGLLRRSEEIRAKLSGKRLPER